MIFKSYIDSSYRGMSAFSCFELPLSHFCHNVVSCCMLYSTLQLRHCHLGLAMVRMPMHAS